MANAKRDDNRIPTLIGVSSADGSTPLLCYVDPTTHRLLIDSNASGGFTLLPATGLVNGANAAFTFTQQPTYIVSDHQWYRVNIGWTWNNGTLTATMSVPPNDDVWGFV